MAREPLPSFRYHPDPLGSGSVAPSRRTCRCCGRGRGYVYVGPVYAEEELSGRLCPWCIADGGAAGLGAEFVDAEECDGGVPEAVVRELCERTPGFDAWGRARWVACCGDAAAFLGPMGIAEARALDRGLEGVLMGSIVHGLGISGGAAVRALESLARGGSPVAMVFRCLSCGTHLGYADAMIAGEG